MNNFNNKKTALIIEGGGMRGVFSAGILDSFHEETFDPFDMYFGVSAGACNLSAYLAGQYGRNYRCYTDYMIRPEFFSLKKFLRGGHFMDLDWFWDFLDETDKLDTEKACSRKNQDFFVTATDVNTGKPCYMKAVPSLLNDMLKGSSSVPLMYRNFINVMNLEITDGGVSDSIPAEEAVRRGAEKLMIIRSRPSGYIKKSLIESKIIPQFFSRYPALRETLKNREKSYMKSLEFIKNPPEGIEIIQICPDELKTGRTTTSVKILQKDYSYGRQKGIEAIKLWHESEK